MLEKIIGSCIYVSENSKDVKINYEVVDDFLKEVKEPSFWLADNPFGVLEMNIEDIVNFLLVLHTIGDYCFWGDPKWEIRVDDKVLDGTFAIMYVVIQRFKKDKSFKMSFEDFKKLLEGNIEIPLLKERYEELEIMNNFLDNRSFYNMIKDIRDDKCLFDFIIDNLPYFKDERVYKNETIYFYKRAQLLTSDILHIRALGENVEVHYNNLVGCADYKIPQIMNSLGMIQYSELLNEKIANKEEIAEGSTLEIEIRANSLVAIDYIYRKLNKKIARMDINDILWLKSQDKKKINKKYHRTKTVNY